MTNHTNPKAAGLLKRPFLVFSLCLFALLGVLFFQSFVPGKAHFSNDGPLGAIRPLSDHVMTNFRGGWQDLTWLGGPLGATSPNITEGLLILLGAVGYAKFYAPVSLLVLGLCAWFFFRQLKLGPLACALGGLAAALNSDFLSAACWGVASQTLTFGLNFLALGLLADNTSPRRWMRVVLAGFAVGMGLMEGADIGAIFSLYVAAFVMYQAFISHGSAGSRITGGVIRTALVAVFAALMAAQTITELVGTQIKGVAGMQQDTRSREDRWDWATQWSLPKMETIRVAIPGLFGYRMDTPEGGQYWGTVGRQPGWEQHHQGFPRYSGGGEYAGLLVLVVAAWALAQSFRKQGSPFDLAQRQWIWFWGGMAFVSLLLAFGRHAPFYRLLYALPYFSTIRNPAKFMHNFHWCLLVIFAYGLHGMARCYLEDASARAGRWFQGFDRKWTLGLLATVGICGLGCLAYTTQGRALEQYLVRNAFNATDARQIISFSNTEIGLFLVFLILTATAVIMVVRGTFAGVRAPYAGVWLGLLLVIDLARANGPWIKFYDYAEKYASNPIVDFLRQNANEHRVHMFPYGANQALSFFQQVYGVEWMQHLFQYYGVQSIDIIQMPREPMDYVAFRKPPAGAFSITKPEVQTRLWELTNTRYLCGLAGPFVDSLNQQFDGAKRRFKLHTAFNFTQGDGGQFLVKTNSEGPFALLEFSGALPRARLYSRWQVSTNDEATLKQLASPEFDAAATALVASEIPASAVSTNQELAPVEFVPQTYTPKRLVLKSKATVPTVLLLNDKFDPDWKAFVDGQPVQVLRCNYIMRGVSLPAGEHRVEFRYEPPVKGLYISLGALLFAVAIAGFLALSNPAEP